MTVIRWKRIPRMSAPWQEIVSGGEKTETGRVPESVCGGREIGTRGLLADLTAPSMSTAEIEASARTAASWGLLSSIRCVMQSV
jgi:hypothetical protein